MTPERLREIATGAVLRGDFLTEETQEVAYALFAYADLLKAQAPPEATGLQVDWSFIRRVLEQGAAIQQDYAAGKYPTYEHFSARIDEAARERLATISAPVEPRAAHSANFTEWLRKEMPAGTVIGDPSWWAGKLLAAAIAYTPKEPDPPPGEVLPLTDSQCDAIIEEMEENDWRGFSYSDLRWFDDMFREHRVSPTKLGP